MTEHFRFFDSANPLAPDRTYNAQEFTDYFKALVTTGVMKGTGNELKVTTNGGTMVTTIDNGIAFLLGRYYENDSALALTHEIEAVGKSRIDRVVIRMDLHPDARNVKAVIKRGVASGTPTPPTLTQTNELYEISLAQVLVVGGQTFIDSSAITDERGVDVICPWAGSKILPNFNDDALENMVTSIESHLNNKNNPHQVTAEQIIPEIDRNINHRVYFIHNSLGDDNNDGLSMSAPFKTIEKMIKQIKPIMFGTMEINLSGTIENSSRLILKLSEVRSGGLITINFSGMDIGDSVEIEGCGAPLLLQNFVTSKHLRFKKCAPVFIENGTFNLSNYTSNLEILLVSAGVMNVENCSFNSAQTGKFIMYAANASVMSIRGVTFTNCATSSFAYIANNSILMHTQNTVIGGTSPILATEYGGGKVFHQP